MKTQTMPLRRGRKQMTFANNQYRVVANIDRNTTVAIFPTIASAQEFSRSGRYEIQRAVEATDGTVAEWERTALSMSRRKWAGNL